MTTYSREHIIAAFPLSFRRQAAAPRAIALGACFYKDFIADLYNRKAMQTHTSVDDVSQLGKVRLSNSHTLLPMPLVKLKTKNQVTIPQALLDKANITKDALLEVEYKNGQFIMAPKEVIPRGVLEGLADIKAGRVSPAFETVEEMKAWLHRDRSDEA